MPHEKIDEMKTITLPNRDDMLASLIRVNGNSHMQEKFYPLLLKAAGQELVAPGIIMMFALAIHDYTKDMPPVLTNLLYQQVPQFIDAVVKDPEIAKDAKDFLEESIQEQSNKTDK